MIELLELDPTSLAPESQNSPLTGVINQFTGLTQDLAFPKFDTFPTPNNIPLPNLDILTAVVGNFKQISQKLSTDPQTLIQDLQTNLETLKTGSSQIGNLLGSITDMTGDIGSSLDEFPSFFEQFNADIIPVLTTLKTPQLDTTSLIQLLQLDTLATTLSQKLNNVLQTPLQDITAIETQLAPLTDDQWLTHYKSALTAITSIPDSATLTAADLTVLNDEIIAQIQTQVDTFKQPAEAAITKLDTFNGNLVTLSQNLTDSLTAVLDQLDPQNLGSSLPVPNLDLTKLKQFNLSGITDKIEAAAQAVDKLVGQNLDRVTDTLDTLVSSIVSGISTAKQALVQVSAIISDLLAQLKSFIAQANLPGLVDQAKEAFQTLAGSLNPVLNQVNQIITQVYDFIKGIVQKIDQLDLRPIIQTLHDILFQITAFLDRPQVRDALNTAKQGIDEVIKQLDGVTLKPVFDQVVTEADSVKSKLAAVDVSQLNQMLRTALKTALDPLREAIDPAQVTAAVKTEYDQIVKQELIAKVIDPIKAEFDKVNQIIDQFEPGTLVSGWLTPPFETVLAELKKLIAPEQILAKLDGLTQFYQSLLDNLDKNVNPAQLLAPLVGYYDQMMGFVNQLSPETLINPLNDLLQIAQTQLNGLGIETIIEQINQPVNEIVQFATNFRLENQPFWQPIQGILDIKLDDLLNGFVQQLRGTVNQLNSSAIEPLLRTIRSSVGTIKTQIQNPELLTRVQTLLTQTKATIKKYLTEMTALAEQWQAANTHLNQLSPSHKLTADYNTLKQRLQSLNPISILAAPTNVIKQIETTLDTISQTLNQTWQQLIQRLKQDGKYIETLLSDREDALKGYLNQVIDSFVNGSVKEILPLLSAPIAGLKRAISTVSGLQKHLDVLPNIPETMERIGNTIIDAKNAIASFNFNFLTDELQGLMDTVIQPLKALNPQTFLDELSTLYQGVLKTLRNLNPVDIIASARGTVTLKRKTTTGTLTIPKGTRLIATTPGGEKPFATLAEITLVDGANAIDVPVQALISGRGGEVVAVEVEKVIWRVETETLKVLTVTYNEPILSLTTLSHDVIFKKLEAFHPEKIVKEALNEPYQKLVKLKNELGIDKIFEALLKALDKIDQELEEGLKQLAIALKGLLAAMPL